MTKKSTALFIVIMLLSTSFNLINIAQPVKAANACCQKTKSGDYCQFTSQDECDPAFLSAPALCENTNFCQLGCCTDDAEGLCYTNSPRSLCEARDGTFSSDPSCSIPQCEKGACVIGNECSFTTLARCKAVAAKFENTGFKFDASIKNEVDALNICRSEEKGCCVSQESCVYGSRASCEANPAGDQGFSSGKFCSDSSLTCNCAPRSYKGCLPAEDDVYWFDSCGNPESKAEECDYASGTVCGQANNDYKCISTSCQNTYSNPASPDSGGEKRSGESWCIYDASVGFGSDVVGSRHYRSTCINGEEIIEPCKDFREELCISNDVDFEEDPGLPLNPGSGRFIEAVCRTNRWQDCTSIDNQGDCENQDLRDCSWQGERCVPHIPPGFKFWEGEGTDICAQANQECTVLFRRPGIGLLEGGIRQWECVGNCECLSRDWVVGANNLCKALGDCGAYYNIAGDVSLDGFSSTEPRLTAKEVGDWSAISAGSQSAIDQPGTFQQIWDRTKAGLVIAGFTAVYTKFAHRFVEGAVKGTLKDGFLSGIDGFRALGNPNKMAEIGAKNYIKGAALESGTSLLGKRLPQGTMFKSESLIGPAPQGAVVIDPTAGTFQVTAPEGIVGTADMVATEGTVIARSNFATALQWLNTIMWIYTIYQIADVIFADTKEETLTATCEPWQAISGGNKCELCNTRGLYNGKDYKPCTEYACKSLGQGCKLLNEGQGNETCVFVSPRDASSPVLTPLTDVLPQGYNVQSLNNGYRISPNIKPFELLSFGVKTNEPAQCKITNKLGTPFKDVQSFLGTSQYSYNHIASVKIPNEIFEPEAVQITNGGQYSFYVRCQDGNGNDNDQDYIIQFNVQPGPDLTPPSVDQVSIPNGGFVRNNALSANVSFFMNEPAQCKWSFTDSDYSIMPNKMSCALSSFNPSPNNLYECSTMLTGIKDDAINRYFVRCSDKSNNTMQESYTYNLIGTIPLRITDKQPSGKVSNPILTIKTADGATKDGKSICGYGKQDNLASMIQFLNTGNNIHTQPLSLEDGTYTFHIKCLDDAGNVASESVTFTSFIDKLAPGIIRLYEDRSLSRSVLHIKTNEISICEYSNKGQFIFGKGIRMPTDLSADHEAPWGSLAYYIICADASNNTGPLTVVFP